MRFWNLIQSRPLTAAKNIFPSDWKSLHALPIPLKNEILFHAAPLSSLTVCPEAWGSTQYTMSNLLNTQTQLIDLLCFRRQGNSISRSPSLCGQTNLLGTNVGGRETSQPPAATESSITISNQIRTLPSGKVRMTGGGLQQLIKSMRHFGRNLWPQFTSLLDWSWASAWVVVKTISQVYFNTHFSHVNRKTAPHPHGPVPTRCSFASAQ